MFNEFLCISFCDILHLLYCDIYNIKLNSSTRWFFLHFIVNCIIVYYSISDTKICFLESDNCYKIPWNVNSIKTYKYATYLHIYHCLFFMLTKEDYLHHILMVIICGTCCYFLQSIISSFALFFLTGLPGAIDYLLLYLVKRNKLNMLTEKKIYVLISAYIRSPGCIYTLAIGMNGILNYYYNSEYWQLFRLGTTLFLIYWNGSILLNASTQILYYKTIKVNLFLLKNKNIIYY